MSFNAIEYINSFSHTGKKVTDLSRISGLLKRLDNPQNGQKFVHIAGTNGKGSTLEYMSEILIKAGYRTGQFTSPFIEEYNDRIRINGENIPDERLEEICGRVKSAVSDEIYSQFEITFAVALIYFLEEKCDIVFLETGIGGLLDATNIIESPLLSVITSVSLDHTQLLGNTVAEIAVQKTGIIKKGCPVILSADNIADTVDIARKKAAECSSPLVMPELSECVTVHSDISGTDFKYKGANYRINMCGSHQVNNAITAIEAVNILRNCGFSVSDKALKQGLESAKVKLRIEVLSKNPPVIADGGHNISGIDSLIDIIKSSDRSIIGIVGMMNGKNPEYAGKRLSEILDTAICADGYIENNMDARELMKYFSCPCEACDYKTALKKAMELAEEKNSAVLICGSLYLASAARREFTEKYRNLSI